MKSRRGSPAGREALPLLSGEQELARRGFYLSPLLFYPARRIRRSDAVGQACGRAGDVHRPRTLGTRTSPIRAEMRKDGLARQRDAETWPQGEFKVPCT